jgi:thimet oligopeptidase
MRHVVSSVHPKPSVLFALVVAVGSVSGACGGTAPSPSSPTANVTNPMPPNSTSNDHAQPGSVGSATSGPFDPVAVGLTPAGVTKLCDDHLKSGQALLDQIKALKGGAADALTYASTIGKFDDAMAEVSNAQSFPYLMGVAHPDKAVRDAAKLCEPKVDVLLTGLYLDPDLAAVIKAYAAKGEKLEGEKARLLAETLRDFRRNGLDLPPEKQELLRKYNAEITDIGQKFEANIGASTYTISVDPKSLEGLPPDFVAKHSVKDGKVEISTDYPDFFPFVTYSKDRAAALDLYIKFTNRGGEENVKLLERLLKLRSDKAKLLGYPTWADYAIEPRMAKSAKTVRAFLERVREAVKAPAKIEFAEMMKEHVALGGKATDKLPPVERYFLEDRVRQKKYNFDSKELANYFEIGAVKKGLLDITAKMYGLEYKEVPPSAWHPDVTAYDVYSGGKVIGKFYLDLYPRADKFKHAAMFSIRQAKRLPDGTYTLPMAALECNFPRPSANANEPALMKHDEVVTFFHEFGHVLHHILTQSDLATYSGSNTVRDFVEAPSQMFEEWAWSRDVLDLFAKHYKTGEKIPDALFTSMQKSRTFGRAMGTQRQLFLALLDQEYHTREPGYDTTKVVEEVQSKTDQFVFVKGTHFQSSFGHLVGYDAGYYSYQWALSLSRDVLTRFKKEGMLNAATAKAWRDEVLAKGGGVDERSMIAKFLGREPNDDAYVAFLKGAE